MSGALTAAELAELERMLPPEDPGPCPYCGGPLELRGWGGGKPTIWGCPDVVKESDWVRKQVHAMQSRVEIPAYVPTIQRLLATLAERDARIAALERGIDAALRAQTYTEMETALHRLNVPVLLAPAGRAAGAGECVLHSWSMDPADPCMTCGARQQPAPQPDAGGMSE